jgi:hypothetical protein
VDLDGPPDVLTQVGPPSLDLDCLVGDALYEDVESLCRLCGRLDADDCADLGCECERLLLPDLPGGAEVALVADEDVPGRFGTLPFESCSQSGRWSKVRRLVMS